MSGMPPILHGRRVAVLGSGQGLGLAVAAAAEAAGAEVLGVDAQARFDHLSALYRADPADPAAMDAVAAALPDGIDALALFPPLPDGDPARQLAAGLAAPLRLAALLAPRLARGGAIVVQGAAPAPDRADSLAAIRAGGALRPGGAAAFAAAWGLTAEPARTPRVIGWAMQAAIPICWRTAPPPWPG